MTGLHAARSRRRRDPAVRTPGYRPELDGIRALALLGVIGLHTGIPIAQGGWMGVDVFFVLSGYLITTLLLAEQRRHGRIDLPRFYARRALRLYPALIAVVLVGAVFHRELTVGGSPGDYAVSAAGALLYVQDFAAYFAPSSVGALGHTWSLAIEEQFYVLWPLALVLLTRRSRDPLRWVAVAVVVGWVVMVVSMRPSATGVPDASYFLPWNRFPQLLVGAAVAMAVARWGVPRALRRPTVGWAAAGALVALVLVASGTRMYPQMSWQAPATALAAGLLLWNLAGAGGSSLGRALGCGPLRWLGQRSYGVYLIHLPALAVISARLDLGRAELTVVLTVVSVAAAALLYRFVETPFLRRKARLQPATTVSWSDGGTAATHAPVTADGPGRSGRRPYAPAGPPAPSAGSPPR